MRYFIDPFGCVKNQVDAENMMAYLNKAGWENSTAEDAELIIINSCGFIKSAKQESIDAVLGWRRLYPDKKILLAGCLAQRYKNELPETLTEADGFFGVDNIKDITQIASQIINPTPKFTKQKIEGAGQAPGSFSQGERPLLSLPGSAYVKISEGCNNCCSYCAIPLIRGNLVSRQITDIVEECRILLLRGIKEICIVGQDIGSYGKDWQDSPFGAQNGMATCKAISKLPELLNAISLLEGHFWVRLLYIHPDHFPLQILDIMERDTRFLPYFDIPFQHASEKILIAMNRQIPSQHKTAEKYLELIKIIRKRLPHAVIRSTFLLGFPGETEEDFAALLDFQQNASLDWLGCFTYSREEGTASYSMKERVPAKIAAMRKQTIEERQVPITEKNMERFAGQSLDVLIEEEIITSDEAARENTEPIWLGRLYCQAPDIDGAAVILCNDGKRLQTGSLVSCKVIARRGFDLELRAHI